MPPADGVRATGYRETIPLIQELALAPSGELWVRRRTHNKASAVTDLFRPNGEYAGTLAADSPFPARFLGNDRILVVEKDSNDLARVSLFHVGRFPSVQ